MKKNRHVLVTGATGYIGGRLIPMLLKKRLQVRVLVRNPNRLEGRVWNRHVDVVQGDLLDEKSLRAALRGVDNAYYLVHSMYSGRDFEQRDRQLARCAADLVHVGDPQIERGGRACPV